MKPVNTKPPPAVLGGLALAVVLDTFIQIAWKQGTAGTPANASAVAALGQIAVNPWFGTAMLAFAAQLWNWCRVLARADLSYAQPITALSYISVLAVSAGLLHEKISPGRMAGVGLILAGVWLVSRTPFKTAASPGSGSGDEGPTSIAP